MEFIYKKGLGRRSQKGIQCNSNVIAVEFLEVGQSLGASPPILYKLYCLPGMILNVSLLL